jgi:hypothetical protein
MAEKFNTIEYGWVTNETTTSGSVLYTSPSKSIYIPETSNRNFESAILNFYVRDGISGTTIRNMCFSTASLGLYIGSNYATQSFYGTTPVATTGDHYELMLSTPFTNHFNSYFTGTSQSVQYTWQTPTASGTSQPFVQHVGKLILTYRYDDSGLETAIKTVRIPFDSHTATTPTAQRILYATASLPGTIRNLPELDTYLPENNKLYRDIFLEVFSKHSANATTHASLSLQIDSGSLIPRLLVSSSLNTSVYYYDIWSGSIDTSTQHAITFGASLANRFSNTCALLNVTYQYDYTSSTVMNSLILASTVDSLGPAYRMPNLTYPVAYKSKIFIPEANPVIKKSAFYMTPILQSGSPAFTPQGRAGVDAFSLTLGSTESGPFRLQICFDSSSANAQSTSSPSLIRGFNSIDFSFRSSTPLDWNTFPDFRCILNYTSENTFNNNRTIIIGETSSFFVLSTTPIFSFPFVFSGSYYLNSSFIEVTGIDASSTTNSVLQIFKNTGIETMSFQQMHITTGDSELQGSVKYYDTSYVYKKYRESFENKLNYNDSTILYSAMSLNLYYPTRILTYHTNTAYVSCSLNNCNFPLSTYNIYFHLSGSDIRQSQPIYILNISGSSVNKSGSFDWYDNFQNIYAVCYTPEFGISNMLTAGSGSHTIDFSTPTAGGEHSYTFIG